VLRLSGFPIREYGFQVQHEAPLNQLVDQLASQDQSSNRLLIVGHADDSNAEETNRRIARLRAAEVLWQLRRRLQQRGLNVPMDYEGRGSTELVVTGEGKADPKRNRRVEVLYCLGESIAVDAFSYPAIGWRRFWRPGWARRAPMLRQLGVVSSGHPAIAFRRPGTLTHPFARPAWRSPGFARPSGPPTLTSLRRPVQRTPRPSLPIQQSTYPTLRRMAVPRRFGGRGRSR
jgi:hypothetical protein